MFSALGDAGLTRVLVEGGGHLAAGLLRADLVDRLQWFRAAGIMGGDGVPAVAAYGIDRLSLMRRYRLVSVQSVAEDLFESYVRHD
jgi:diaminohydroxyphosphoribosylaminopyrimidine deaminase/5-amino-6-(5-phosphoribosylamino)uracil reductase